LYLCDFFRSKTGIADIVPLCCKPSIYKYIQILADVIILLNVVVFLMLYRILGWKMLHVYTLIHFRENINKWIGEIVIRFVVCCAVLHISAMFSRLMKFLAQADQSIRFCDVFFGDGTKHTELVYLTCMQKIETK